MTEFDYDYFVIGAGSAGVRSARIAAGFGARVAIAEGDRVGGTCVIRGCVPKKLFVHAAHFADAFEDAVGFGWTVDNLRFDWPTLRDNVAKDVTWLSGVYVRNLEKAGVELIHSRAVLDDAHKVRLLADGRTVTARYVLVATGGMPHVDPATPGIEHTITSNEMFHLEKLPKRLVVIGGGYIALEFAGAFNNFGTETTVIHRGGEILRGFDAEVRKAVRVGMEHQGIEVITDDTLIDVERKGERRVAVTKAGQRIEADQILIATGRRPNTKDLGLEAAGVEVDETGAVVVDDYSRSSAANIYAVGDVTNRVLLTPVAIREGEAVADTLFGNMPRMIDYRDIPKAVFSHPEIGTVGLTEEQAKHDFSELDIYRSNFKPLPNRVANRDERMLIKLIVDASNGRVLGCHFVGPSASELAQLVAIPLKMGATKADFDAATAIHPTLAEEIVTLAKPSERYRRDAAE